MKEIKAKTVLDEQTDQFYFEGLAEHTKYKDSNIAHYLDELSRPNLLINGDFQVWQRGDTFSLAGYTVDRWAFSITSGNEPVLKKIDNGVRIIETTASMKDNQLDYFMETKDTMRLSKKTITLSISKVGSVKMCVRIRNDHNYTVVAETLENELTIEMPEYVDGDMLNVRLMTYQNVDINWVKLELGSFATSFIPKQYAEELALCQRYYVPSVVAQGLPYANKTTTAYYCHLYGKFPQTMRIVPKVKPLSMNISNIGFISNPSVLGGANQDGIIGAWTIEFGKTINVSTYFNYLTIVTFEADAEIY